MSDLVRAALVISLDEQRKLRDRLKQTGTALEQHRQDTDAAILAVVTSIEHARADAARALAAAVDPVHERLGSLADRLTGLTNDVADLPGELVARIDGVGDELRQALAMAAAKHEAATAGAKSEAATALAEAMSVLAEEIGAVEDWAVKSLEGRAAADERLTEGLARVRTELAAIRQDMPAPVSAADIQAAARAAVEDLAPQLVGAPGRPGLVWRGKWDRLTAYAKSDVVGHRGSSWVATRDVIGIEPRMQSDAWDLLARAGADGGGRTIASEALPPPAPAEYFFEASAGQSITAGQVVVIEDSGIAALASAANRDHAGRIVAIARSSALVGNTVRLSRVAHQEGSWSFSPGRAVYLGLNGEITQDNSAGLFQQELGVALSATQVLFQPGLCIVRN